MPFHSLSAAVPGPPGPAGPGTFTEETSIVSVRDYGAIGDGVIGDRNAIYNAIAAASNRELLFPAGTYRVESDLTFSSTVAVRFLNGAKLSIDSGVNVTINGPLEAGLYQIFSGDGSVNIGKGTVPMVYPQWWGAVGDGVADDSSAIQAGIDVVGYGGTVYLASGIYRTTSGLTFPKDYVNYVRQGVILQGAGIGATTIKYTSATGYAIEFSTGPETTAKTVSHHTIRDLRIEAPNTDGGAARYESACHNKLEGVALVNIPNGKAIFMEKNNYGSWCILNYFNEVFIASADYGFYMKDNSQALIDNCNIAYINHGIYAEGGLVWVSNTQVATVLSTDQALNMSGGNSTWRNAYLDRGNIVLNGGLHTFRSSYLIYMDWTDGTRVDIGKDCTGAYVQATDISYIPGEFNPIGIIMANDSRNPLSGGASEADDPEAANGRCVQLDSQSEILSIRFNPSYYGKALARGKYLFTIYAKDSNQVANDFRVYTRVNGVTRNTRDSTLTPNYTPNPYIVTIAGNEAGGDTQLWMLKLTAEPNIISIDYVDVRYLGPDVHTNEIVLHNPVHTDAAFARASRIQFWGEQSGGEISSLAEIKASHDGAADDQRGRIEIGVNNGSDKYSPRTSLSICGDGRVDVKGRLCTSTISTFASGDATPSVSSGNVFRTANGILTTIIALGEGSEGQSITVIIGDDNTIVDFTGTNLKGNNGTDWTPASGDHMTCVFDGTNWYCNVSDNTP